jgi:formylglycine-generating enzyme required for sulfatase activity
MSSAKVRGLSPASEPATDPLQPFLSPRAARVFRGGSFGFWSEGDDLQIRFCRSASRYQGLPDERYPYVGFRLARTHC